MCSCVNVPDQDSNYNHRRGNCILLSHDQRNSHISYSVNDFVQLYGPRTVTVPKMPSLGLLLEYPIFNSYNDRIASTVNQNLQPSDAEYRFPIDFEVHRAAIDEFKQEQIYTRMRTSEDRSEVYVLPYIVTSGQQADVRNFYVGH